MSLFQVFSVGHRTRCIMHLCVADSNLLQSVRTLCYKVYNSRVFGSQYLHLIRSDLTYKWLLLTADLPVLQCLHSVGSSVTECRTYRTRCIMQTCLAYSNCTQSVFCTRLCYASSAIFPQSKHNTASVWSSLTANKQRSNLTTSPVDAL